jgi:hypothetical protein
MHAEILRPSGRLRQFLGFLWIFQIFDFDSQGGVLPLLKPEKFTQVLGVPSQLKRRHHFRLAELLFEALCRFSMHPLSLIVSGL